ncbi:hypothetical protein GmHk_18G051360 [Glycine max]|nr:hypothetical protein GmHk_18G051360 [Glycine max]KAH1197615.1 hypothetical protein GmHk_18G051360 [Glycine max]
MVLISGNNKSILHQTNDERAKAQGVTVLQNSHPQGNKNVESGRTQNAVSTGLTKAITTMDEFKCGFPSKGLSTTSNKWWGNTDRDDCAGANANGAKMAHETVKAENSEIPRGSSLLKAVRKRAVEEGREALKLEVFRGYGINKLSKREKTLLHQIFGSSLPSILFANTAKEISEDLKTRFSRKNGPRIFQLRGQLLSLQQGNDDVSYKPTFQGKCGGLQTLQDYIESEYVMSFLMGLNDSFAQVWGQILLSDPLPPIGNVFSLVIQEEAQREIVVNHIPSLNSNTMAFAVNSTAKNPTNGKSRNAKKERPQCAHCNLLGHTKDKCYKLVIDHDESPSQGATNTLSAAQCQELISLLTKQLNTENNVDTLVTNVSGICMNTSFDFNESCHYWILDLGVTSHICCSKEQFNSFKCLHDSHVLLPNSTMVKVEGIGRLITSITCDTLIIGRLLI